MSRAHDLFRPNGLKLLLALMFLVPVYFVLVFITGFPYSDMLLPAAITVAISYGAACVIEGAIQSRTVKIAIASVAAIVSIILGYILVRSMTMVYDPVHLPETTAPTVIATTGPTITTPMVFHLVHEPNSGGEASRNALDHATGTPEIVAQKLDECLQNCNR